MVFLLNTLIEEVHADAKTYEYNERGDGKDIHNTRTALSASAYYYAFIVCFRGCCGCFVVRFLTVFFYSFSLWRHQTTSHITMLLCVYSL